MKAECLQQSGHSGALQQIFFFIFTSRISVDGDSVFTKSWSILKHHNRICGIEELIFFFLINNRQNDKFLEAAWEAMLSEPHHPFSVDYFIFV